MSNRRGGSAIYRFGGGGGLYPLDKRRGGQFPPKGTLVILQKFLYFLCGFNKKIDGDGLFTSF